MSFGDFGLGELAPKKKDKKPTPLELIYYLFWKRGISLKEFNELPLPYIFGILKTYSYLKEEEKKELDKAKRK